MSQTESALQPNAEVSIAEVKVFSQAAAQIPANRVTACRGWTAHDLLAHVVAGGAEMARLVGLHLQGKSHEATTPFEEREAAFREIPYLDLVDLLSQGGLTELIGSMATGDEEARLDFTGWSMDAGSLGLHIRSELAVHAWDLVGSTPNVVEVLSQPELTEHAVNSLNNLDVIAERSHIRTKTMVKAGHVSLQARLRVRSGHDVLLEASESQTRLSITAPTSDPALTSDSASRLLMLWGRIPPAAHASTSDLNAADRQALHAWLHG